MKWLLVGSFLMFLGSCSDDNDKTIVKIPAQDTMPLQQVSANPYVPLDLSPMDMSYLPDDYPVLKMNGKIKTPPVARVIYSRPHKQGRKIFGGVLKYGERWRLGANEATEMDVFQPLVIQHKTIPAGRYVLYCIPEPDKWTVVFNSNLDSWGLQQDTTRDLYRFAIPVAHKNQSVEYFSIVFQPNQKGNDLVMAWEDVEVRLPIENPQK
jgi:Protein of unknown function (DUF2911)